MTDQRISIISKRPDEAKHIIVPIFEDESLVDFSGLDIPQELISGFKGKLKEKISSLNSKGQIIHLLGLGKQENISKIHDAFRSFAFHKRSDDHEFYVMMNHRSEKTLYQCVLGLCLGEYSVSFFKEKEEPQKASFKIIHSDLKYNNEIYHEAISVAETQKSIMRLVDYPSNIKTPEFLANWAKSSGKKYGFNVQVIAGDEVKKKGFHALWEVGRGAENLPRFIIMEYKPDSLPDGSHSLGLVGKGITFDTGGISIKPFQNMHYMKSDMGGAAAVFGAVELAAKLYLPLHVIGIVPAAENSVDMKSFRPGDVIQSYAGKSIEIINTDAEGRLVLADGLAYLQEQYSPDTVIDLATLTGSIVRALGYHAGGMFTKNDELAKQLYEAGERSDNRVWRMPLWDDYQSEMDSDIADIKNLATSPVAGAVTAAKFVEFFISDHPRWVHFDIANVAFGDSEYSKMKSATGFGPRLLLEFMKQLLNS